MDNRTATLDVICCEVLNSPRRAVGKDFWKICMAYGSDLFGGSWWLWNHSWPTCCFSFSSSTWWTFGSLRKNYYLASLLYLREQSADWWFRHSFQVINASSASRHQLDHMVTFTSVRSKTSCSCLAKLWPKLWTLALQVLIIETHPMQRKKHMHTGSCGTGTRLFKQ